MAIRGSGAPGQRGNASDVLVIGAGITGCAAAYYLAKRGLSVRVLERGDVAGEQSSRAWGFVRQQGRHVAEAPLAAEAVRMWSSLADELGQPVDFVQSGLMVLAQTEADERRVVEGARESRAHGVDSKLLTPTEIAALLPGVAGAWRVGMYTERDGHAEPARATRAFATAARRLGVSIQEGVRALAVESSNGHVTGVRTADGFYAAPTVLCAAGVGTAELTRTAGVSLPVQTVRASVAQTVATATRMSMPVWSPHVAFRPRLDGSFTIGNGYRGIDAEHDITLDSFRHLFQFVPTFLANWRVLRLRLGNEFLDSARRRHGPGSWTAREPTVNEALVAHNKEQFERLVPGLRGIQLARSWAGRIDVTPDLIPIVGPTGPDGYFVAGGFNGHGFALAPVVGKLLAQLILKDKPSQDLSPLRPQRFAEGAVRRTKGAL